MTFARPRMNKEAVVGSGTTVIVPATSNMPEEIGVKLVKLKSTFPVPAERVSNSSKKEPEPLITCAVPDPLSVRKLEESGFVTRTTENTPGVAVAAVKPPKRRVICEALENGW